jgi:hypothetical protein
MLFLLTMEPLHKLVQKAQKANLLNRVNPSCDMFRIFLYADDAALFIKPTVSGLRSEFCILDIFAGASGLVSNMEKTQFYPIQCDQINLEFLSQHNL